MADVKGHVDDEQLRHHLKREEKHISQNLQVLVLDDSVVCLKIIASQLRKCGYQVTATTQALEALELLRENKDAYDIVITDVIRPDIDGFKLLEIIRLKMDIPVIMTSANGDTQTVEKGIRHGARDYLVKPVRMEVLQNIWQHVIRKIGQNSNSDAMEATEDVNSNHDRQLHRNEDLPGQSNESFAQKNRRIVWKPELHQKFVAIVEQLSVDKVSPKKILELMNEPTLTRANIASHLQKYKNALKKAKEKRAEQMTRSILEEKILNPCNPIIHATGNHGHTINHNNNYNGYGMRCFTSMNHPSMLLNHSNIMLSNQKTWLTEYANQRMKNVDIHMLQNVAPHTTLVADPGLTAMRYPCIQNQRNSVDHKFAEVSSQLVAAKVGSELSEFFPNLIVGNSSNTLSMIKNKSYSCSSNSFGPAISHQVGYTQTFPTSNSISGNIDPHAQPFMASGAIGLNNGAHLALPFLTSSATIQNYGHLSQRFPVASSVGVNAHLAIPFSTSISSSETNIHHEQLFSTANSTGEKNDQLVLPFPVSSLMKKNSGQLAKHFPGGSSIGANHATHVATPLPIRTSVGEDNSHPQALPPTNSVGENNGPLSQPFPTGSSLKESNEHHSQSFQANSFVEGSSGYHAQLVTTNRAMGENNGHDSQPFPDVSNSEKNCHGIEIKDCLDDELSFMLKQFTDDTSPSL